MTAMDTHFDQVMRAREAAAGDPPRRYFAYSTILDRAAFDTWRAQHGYTFFDLPAGERAAAIDVALVFDFPSRFWGGRVAGLEPRPGSTVHGVLFEIGGRDWPIVRHKEGAITGMCVEQSLRVRTEAGAIIDATTFATAPERRRSDGPVSAAFVDAIVRGAETARLPTDWIEAVRAAAR
jgi:cation transport regulator ChaC